MRGKTKKCTKEENWNIKRNEILASVFYKLKNFTSTFKHNSFVM